MAAPAKYVVPSSTVISSTKERSFVQGSAVAVEVMVAVGWGVNKAGTGVVVGSGCVGGKDVGGRKGVEVDLGAQA